MARKSRPIWTLDCETDPFAYGRVPKPFLWGIYDGANYNYWEFKTPFEVTEFLSDKEVLVYAHNGGKFDYHYLREWINDDETISVISGRLARFRIGVCEFRDSLNLFAQTKLSDFQKMEVDYRLFEADVREANMPLIREYLKSDCVNLYMLVRAYLDTYGPQFTQAGAAMKYWAKHYANSRVPNSTREFYDTYHPFYFGGRVQCFASGHAREDFNVVDINSAYPHAMLERHAYSTHAVVSEKLPPEGRVGQCMVQLEATAKGCFPLRGEDGLYFPEDEKRIRTYFVTGWELLAAFETNSVQVHRIVKVHHFSEIVSFAPYVNHFYELRKRAKTAKDKAQDIFAKIFPNSLYGKFAANPERYREFVLASDEKRAEWLIAGYSEGGFWGGRRIMTRALPEKRHKYYNIATAASITGYVRAHLWRALNQCSGMLYCDTDAIAARDTARLEIGEELGQWKLEAQCDEYAIAGKKLYAFHKKNAPMIANGEKKDWSPHWKVASKGVQFDPSQIIRVAKGERIKAQNMVPNYSLHRGDIVFIDRDIRSTYRDISKLEWETEDEAA